MKKVLSVFLVVVLCFTLLCGCKVKKNLDGETSKPQVSSSQTEQPAVSPPDTATALEFCRYFAGTWSLDSGEFVNFSEDEGKPTILFAKWGVEDYSEIAIIETAEKIDETSYKARLCFEKYNENSDNEYINCTVKNLKTGYIEFTLDGRETVNYFYDNKLQYPIMQ